MRKHIFIEITLIMLLGVSVFFNWKIYSNQNSNLNTKNETEKPEIDIDEYGGSVLQIGGVGSKIAQLSAWFTTENGYLSPAEDWIKFYFNTPGDMIFVSCKEGYSLTSCKSSSGNRISPASDETRCGVLIEDKMQNWTQIKCLKKTK